MGAREWRLKSPPIDFEHENLSIAGDFNRPSLLRHSATLIIYPSVFCVIFKQLEYKIKQILHHLNIVQQFYLIGLEIVLVFLNI
jgi:hypothetical protein